MDYVQEELLRQRRMLAELMTGGSRETAETAEAEEEMPLRRAARENEVRRSQRTAAEEVYREQRRFTRGTAYEAGRSAAGGSVVYETAEVTGGERTVISGQAARTDVQAVSRAIQRDARRYDGGFSLY